MRIREIAFKFEGSNNIIFGTFMLSSEILFFKNLSDDENVKEPREVLKNYFDLNRNNVMEYEELIKIIENDNTIIDKIKRNEKPKLLFQYEMPKELEEALNN